MTCDIVSALDAMILIISDAFQARSARNFATLVRGLLLCLGRPTVTNMARAAGEPNPERPSRLHRFFSRAAWDPEHLARVLVVRVLMPLLAAEGTLVLAGDDTTHGKCGRRVAFAGLFRDAVASSPVRNVLHWSHNWVVACLIVPCPLAPTRRLHLPVLARLYRREVDCSETAPFRTRQQMMVEMIRLVSTWLPGRAIVLVVDGAYAGEDLLKELPDEVTLISRMRRDAALYELPPVPARSGRYGRPRVRGAKLAKLPTIAETAQFVEVEVLMYGQRRNVQVATFEAVWYPTSKRILRLVISRDPEGKRPDDFFFTTARGLEAARVVELYAERWGVEELIREVKQSLGADEVQSWSAHAVVRQVPFVLAAHALVQAAFYASSTTTPAQTAPPSFARMLTRVRMQIWTERLSDAFAHSTSPEKVLELLENTLLTAA